MEPADASRFSLHSLRTTTLSWAMQVGVKVEHRAAQGHHRQAYVSRCVSGYARDDVLPQLQCQEAILKALLGGWEPIVPLQRGVARRAMSK